MKGTTASTTPTAHSTLGASSMYRWSNCPGSVKLSEGIPTKSSPHAREGTAGHEASAIRLTTGKYPARVIVEEETFPVTSEMIENLEVYVKAVEDAAFGCEKLVEHQFNLSSVHPGCFGTCDAVVFDKKESTLRVFDLKYGAGIPVEVFEDGKGNSQLMYYGLGALLSTNFGCEWVELIIVQPRCPHPAGPVRRWKFPTIDLLDFATELKHFAEATENENAILVPGDHCRFCPAAGCCSEIKNKAQAIAKKEFKPVTTESGSYDPQELATTLANLDMVEAWAKSVRDFAYAEANRGKSIPGWKLVEKRKTRKWDNEEYATEFLQREFPLIHKQFLETPSLKSPAAIEKILHKKQHDKISHLIKSVSTGNALVPESDPRQSVIVLDAKTEFKNIL